MINSLSYKLIRQPNTISEEVFTPNKNLIKFLESRENIDSRILVIQASNSSGKSFLLNSIAYIFNGLELSNEELAPTLRRSINYLIDEEHQTFDFNLSISDPDGFELETSYNVLTNNEIVIKRPNGSEEIISKTDFIQQYKLLYDIPEKPLDRIYQLLKSIKDFNNNLLNKLNPLDIKIDNVLKSIREERNEEVIKKIKERINSNNQLLDSYKLKLKIIKNNLRVLENKQNLSKLKQLVIDLENCSIDYDSINEVLKNLKQPSGENIVLQKKSRILEFKSAIKDLKISNKIYSFKDDIENNAYSKEIFNNFSQSELKNLENIFDKADSIIDFLYDNDIEQISKIAKGLTALKDYSFRNFFIFIKSKLDEDDYILIKNLASDFKKYKDYDQNNLIIKGLFNKNVNEILNELTHLEEKYSEINKLDELEKSVNYTIRYIITNLNEGSKKAKLLFTERKKLKKEPSENKLYNDTLDKKSLLEIKKSNYTRGIQSVTSSLVSGEIIIAQPTTVEIIDNLIKSLHIKKYHSKEAETDQIKKYKYEIIKYKSLIESTERYILDDDAKFRNENAKQNSLFSNHQKTIQMFSNKLSYFTKYLNQNNALINDNGELNSTNSKDNISYMKIIGEFVASLMDNKILYQDATINISYIDYASKTPCFVTDENKRIAFSDFSGGQGSSNYLKAKLNLSDDRKYIVLLDEISNMDNKSLKEVIDRLKVLENNNKLLMAILVEPVKEENIFKIQAY